MTPSEIYNRIKGYLDGCDTVICNLHSACAPSKGKVYMCSVAGSKTDVLDFDTVKRRQIKRWG